MFSRSSARKGALALSAILCCSLTACTGSQSDQQSHSSAQAGHKATQQAAPVQLQPEQSGPLQVSDHLAFRLDSGALNALQVREAGGLPVDGEIAADGRSWRSAARLEPGVVYVARGTAKRDDGTSQKVAARVSTQALALDQQAYPSVAPLQGETVGVGMPVVVSFDLPIKDKAAFEKHMTVTSTPSQPGAWRWLSDTEAHWRPKEYWQPGTDVEVDVDVNSLPAGDGIYGQESRRIGFHVGNSVISRVNARTHQMQTFINGQLAKTTPITTGKPGFTTRSGIKVIMEKFPVRRMNSETVGIPAGDAEAYDINDVRYAMRVTYSGEFLHAAPWSVGSQGYANVSHGCTGMSTENAKWIYDRSKRGDVVEYTGTDQPMSLTNGYGDWNVSFKQW